MGAVKVVKGQANLLEVVLAFGATGGFAHSLDRGQQQANQKRDDGNNDQELDQGEGSAADGHGLDPLGALTSYTKL
jgi:hypothetical protein